jgi:uncharacterized protein (TIGR02284 family)
METTEKINDILNDLVQINNDRVAGFEKAGENLEEDHNGLRTIFEKLAGESRNNAAQLTELARQFGSEEDAGTSASGSLHRAWLDIKSTFTGNDQESILDECETGEDAIKKAYASALDDSNELPNEVVQLIANQQQGIIQGHNLIKSLRDQARGKSDQYSSNEGNIVNKDDVWGNQETHFQSDNATATWDEDEADINPNELALANEVTASGPNDYKPIGETRADENEFEPVDDDQYETSVDNKQQKPVSDDSRLKEFFVDELKDLLWAENKLVDTLPKIVEASTSQELRNAFDNHLSETEGHIQRLEQIFGILGLEPDTQKCDAMDGIVDEGGEIIDNTEEGTATRDVGLIFAGQKVEHYEIASYGGMVSLAKTLGYTDIAEILTTTLNEEKAADQLLTEIAENNVNYEASTEEEDQDNGLFS